MRRCCGLLVLVLLIAVAPAAAADGCAPGNLLAGRLPAGMQGAGQDKPTDGTVAPEGTRSNSPLAVLLWGGGARLVYDLGEPVLLSAAYLQGNTAAGFALFGSADGTTYRPLIEFGPEPGKGLRSRAGRIDGPPVRFVAVAPTGLDQLASLAEIAVFCEAPASVMASFTVADKPVWNRRLHRGLVLAAALLALLLVAGRASRPRAVALAGLGVLALPLYVGAFGLTIPLHQWDAFHYYIGGKYFRELGYERIYECVAVADAEHDPATIDPATPLRELRTNQMTTVAGVLAHPQGCKAHFDARRWQACAADVAFFRERENPLRWREMLTDHGYNASPPWMIAGGVLANTGPASPAQLRWLTLIDPLYLVACAAAIGWAFGWRTLSVALLVFATFVPAEFKWTGGSILRFDWLFFTVASVCCMRRGRPLLGGAALGYALALRVFPGALFLGPLLLAAGIWLRERRLDRDCLRFMVGGALATALLLPLGALYAGGFDAYPAFVRNSVKHVGTPSGNNMGLQTVLAFRPSQVMAKLREPQAIYPHQRWQDQQRATRAAMRPLHALLLLAGVGLLWRALRRAPPWAALALASLLLGAIFDLSSYYYAFIIVPALLVALRPRYGPGLLALCAATNVVEWAPLPFMQLPLDEKHALLALATLAVFAAMLADFGRPGSGLRDHPEEGVAQLR